MRPKLTPRQSGQSREVAADQRLLFLSAPTLHLTLSRDRILDASEMLVEDKCYRAPIRRVTLESAGLMFRDALLKVCACRADVVRAVSAAQDVEIAAHLYLTLRDGRCAPSSG
jgi:hypothetical protein